MAGYDSTFASLTYNTVGALGVTFTQERVYVPPQPYVPGTPAVPATQTQIRYFKNKGWNSSARSIEPFVKNTFYGFTCSTGIEGCCIGIARKTFRGHNIASFSHALVCDLDGVQVLEQGSSEAILSSTLTPESDIRVYLDEENIIHYVLTEPEYAYIHGRPRLMGYATIVHKSALANSIINPYIFGFLYSAGESILTSSYSSGRVVYGSF